MRIRLQLAALPPLLGHGALVVLALLLLYAVGRPLHTADAWWHMKLGEFYAAQGPWLDEDPLLHTASGPPSPAAWLFDVGLYALERVAGFQALRLAHVLAVAASLVLAWSLLRRASGSPLAASLGTACFAGLAAYRFVQLRPHLFTILATLVVYRLLVEGRDPPSRGRIVAVVALLVVWANVHAGFLLGPILIATAMGGLLVATPLRAPAQRRGDRSRAVSLAAALGLGLLATLANPDGANQHLAYFVSDTTTLGLERIRDEWAPLNPFRAPLLNLPPNPLAWGIVWILLLGTPAAAAWGARRWWQAARAGRSDDEVDPALVAFAAASLVAMLMAVRFLWLGVFPLLLMAQAGRARWRARGAGAWAPALPWAGALATAALLPGFLWIGDWPYLAPGIPEGRDYLKPYNASKYSARPVWFLRDVGLTGNLFNEYYLGGFIGFWLTPGMKGFANGTLNAGPEAMEAYWAIKQRGPIPGFAELLDEYEVDVFLGLDLPTVPVEGRPVHYTATHLEREPGWMLIFRNPWSGIYLRRSERNRENVGRLVDYFAREGVPFDPERGFDTEQVIREARPWAKRFGLVPGDFDQLEAVARGGTGPLRRLALERLATLYAVLGLYEHAIALDRERLRLDPDTHSARRRLIWSLLHLDRAEEAVEQAEILAGARSPHPTASWILGATRQYASVDEPERRAAIVANLLLLAPAEAKWVGRGIGAPESRTDHRALPGLRAR